MYKRARFVQHIHPIEKTLSGEEHKSLKMRPNGALGRVNFLAPILSHAHNIITRHAVMCSLNYLGKKIF